MRKFIVFVAVAAVLAGSASASPKVRIVSGENDRVAEVDGATHSLVGITYEHHEVHSGSHYSIKGWVDVGANDVATFMIKTTNTTTWPHLVYEFTAEAEMVINVYEDAVATNDGAAIAVYNSNRNVTNNPADTLWFSSPVVTNLGTCFWSATMGSGNKIGGGTRGAEEWVLKQGSTYYVVVSNIAAQVKWFDHHFWWYEHENKE